RPPHVAVRLDRRSRRAATAARRVRNASRAARKRRTLTLDLLQALVDRITAEIRRVIIGQEDVIRYSLVVVLCNQHALIEGVPGLGKTLLARTFAAVLGGEFKRI